MALGSAYSAVAADTLPCTGILQVVKATETKVGGMAADLTDRELCVNALTVSGLPFQLGVYKSALTTKPELNLPS